MLTNIWYSMITYVNWSILGFLNEDTWTFSQYNDVVSPGTGISIIKIRLSWGRRIFIMAICILVGRHLYIETYPCMHYWPIESSWSTVSIGVEYLLNDDNSLFHIRGIYRLSPHIVFLMSLFIYALASMLVKLGVRLHFSSPFQNYHCSRYMEVQRYKHKTVISVV